MRKRFREIVTLMKEGSWKCPHNTEDTGWVYAGDGMIHRCNKCGHSIFVKCE
jgi:hypothetical protein